jgi:hypothetical protein
MYTTFRDLDTPVLHYALFATSMPNLFFFIYSFLLYLFSFVSYCGFVLKTKNEPETYLLPVCVVKLMWSFLHYNTVFVCWIEEVGEDFGGGVVLQLGMQHIDLSRFVIRRIH